MSTTFFGLNIAKSGINSHKNAMEVTANNIANVNTEGYTRQRAVLSSIEPYQRNNFHINFTPNRIGNGVEVSQIEAMRDEFTNAKIVDEKSNYEYKQAASDLLAEIETILNQAGTANLSSQMDAYWKAWENLSNDPSNTSLRNNLVSEAKNMIDMFQEIDGELREMQGTSSKLTHGSLENQISTLVDDINSIGYNIAELNREIGRAEVTGVNANELRDKRQALVEELAEYINIDYFYSPIDGSLTVNCGSHQLIQHTKFNQLYVTETKNDSLPAVGFDTSYPEYSNDPDVATAVFTNKGVSYNGTITVTQLAQAEEQYSFLTYHPLNGPLSNFGTTSGTFTINGREFELNAEKTSIKDLAQMINDANINVIASVNESGQLVMKASETGEDYKIKASDGSSNLITVLNLQVEKEAKNAIFNFNHVEYVTQSNTVRDALDGVTFYLNGKGVADLDMRPIVKEGKLRALMEVRDGHLQDTLNKLNDLAYSIIVETNDIHRSGFNIKGETGINFFEAVNYNKVSYPYKDVIQQMSLSDEVLADLGNIAAAGGEYVNETDRLRTSLGLGDGSNAIKIAQLKSARFFDEGKTTFDGFYNQMVTKVATDTRSFTNEADYSNDMLNQLEVVRSQTAGVSLDEELAKLIQYQHAYNACARVMTTIDQMIDKVVNGMI